MVDQTPLDKIAPDLAAGLRALDRVRSRQAMSRMCALAVTQTGLDDPRAAAALAALAVGRPSPELAAPTQALADELDTTGWDLQDEVDAGRRPDAEYHAAFRTARAASAIVEALADHVVDVAYETYHATGDLAAITAIVRAVAQA